MYEKDIILDAETYELLKGELAALRARVAEVESAGILEPAQVAQQKALLAVVTKIRESLDLDSIFKSTATEVRQLLNADRVGMYRFEHDSGWSFGEFVSEDVLPPFASALAAKIHDYCFGNHAESYRQGRIWAADDIYELDLLDCHTAILSRFQVRANLVVPLLKGNELWGLLCIHQCSGPRQWQESEIDFVTQIAIHLGVALQQAEFFAQLQRQSEQLTQAVAQAVEREKAVAAIIDKIRRSLDISTIFQTTTQEVRHLLKADRVTIYRFNPDWSGEFVVESVAPGWNSLIQEQLNHSHLCKNISACSLKSLANPPSPDTYLQETGGGEFTRGEMFRVCDDIYNTGFSTCYIEALESYQARAYAVIAIYKGKSLWGLLAAYQNSGDRHWQDAEVNFLVQIGTQLGVAIQQAELLGQAQRRSAELQTTLTAQLQKRAEELAKEAERERAIAQVIDKIRRTLDLDTIFQTATTEVRKLLNADRVAVFCFDPGCSCNEGKFVSEDVLPPFNSALTAKVRDRCFGEERALNYQLGQVMAIDNIYEAGLSDCHVAMLSRFQVKANLVLPLFKGDELWGLLCIHQCSSSRQWQEEEKEFVTKIAVHLGVALQQAELLAKAERRSRELQTALAQVQVQKEQQVKAAEQERGLARVIERIRQTLDIDTIFSATTQEVRQILNCDRVVVYRFLPDWNGEFVFESMTLNWIPLVRANIKTAWHDTYLQETQGGRYRNHENFAVDDIYKSDHSECYVEILEEFQIKAYMVVPVFVGEKLWGLLGAYQNTGPRHWKQRELSLLAQVGNQLGVALQQVELLAQTQRQSAELKEAKEAADAANTAKSEFLANMSHELRTPLNAILGFTQLLARDSSLNHQQQEHLGVIARSGEHLLTLLNDVLEMSKIEAGRITLNENSFDLYRLLNSLEEMLQLKAQSKGIELIFECDPDIPQYVRTDESKLRQVLINLLGNAIKFTGEGSVTLRVSRKLLAPQGVSVSKAIEKDSARRSLAQVERLKVEDSKQLDNLQPAKEQPSTSAQLATLYFEVEDTGPGIASAELDTLFEAFIQTETGRKSQEGTGLGLPISQKFVQLMGGSITVSSVLSQGTIFKFDVQIGLAEATQVQTQQPTRRVIGLAPDQPIYRILVADDKWESRLMLVNLLSPLGFEVREAENGQEALALWESWQPHLIWMDMRMPVMDGYQATREIRASLKGQATVIIALTASVFDKQRSVVLSAGCDDFVTKPFREEVIFEKMVEQLGVSYVYEEQAPPTISQSEAPLGSMLPEALAVMPADWVAQLHQAALSAREKLIVQLIKQIPEENAPLVRALTQMVNNLCFDQIVDLTQPPVP